MMGLTGVKQAAQQTEQIQGRKSVQVGKPTGLVTMTKEQRAVHEKSFQETEEG
jgi:hypothetical protein